MCLGAHNTDRNMHRQAAHGFNTSTQMHNPAPRPQSQHETRLQRGWGCSWLLEEALSEFPCFPCYEPGNGSGNCSDVQSILNELRNSSKEPSSPQLGHREGQVPSGRGSE